MPIQNEPLSLALRRIRITAVAVAATDFAILVVNAKFSTLRAAHFTPLVDCILLRIMVAAGALTTAALHVPAASGVRYNMMSFWAFFGRHSGSPRSLTRVEQKVFLLRTLTLPAPLPAVKHLLYRYSEQTRRHVVVTPLGKKIRQLRKEKGYTLEKLADLTESSKSYIWELENKDLPRPSADKITKIANVLGVTADYLMSKSQKPPSDTVLDAAFFRDYQDLDETTKEKIRELVKVWGKKE